MRIKLVLLWSLSLVGLVFSSFLISSLKTNADPPIISLTTSPVLLNLNINPGATSTSTVQLMNDGTHPVQIVMKLLTFAAYGNNGQAAITSIPANNPAASYVSFSPSTFTAQPKVWSKVNVTFKIPKDASLGFYYSIVFSPIYNSQVVPNGANIHGSNAVLALVNTNSANEQKSIQISSFSSEHRLYEFLPADFDVEVRNSGNIYLAPTGDIFISRTKGGKTIGVIPVNSGSGNVLPNSNRIFYASWVNGFPNYKPVLVHGQPEVNKEGRPEYKIDWSNSSISKFRFGQYYANLYMTYSDGTKNIVLHGTIDFYVIPWPILLVILFVALLILLNIYLILRSIARRVRRLKNRKKDKEDTKKESKVEDKK